MTSLSTIDKLDILEQSDNKQFAAYEEEAIVSLALDHPDMFMVAARFMKPDMFSRLEVRMIIAEILNAYEEHSVIPTRQLLRSKLEQFVTEDEPYEEIFRNFDTESILQNYPNDLTYLINYILNTFLQRESFNSNLNPYLITMAIRKIVWKNYIAKQQNLILICKLQH